jgi:hypothetical protein
MWLNLVVLIGLVGLALYQKNRTRMLEKEIASLKERLTTLSTTLDSQKEFLSLYKNWGTGPKGDLVAPAPPEVQQAARMSNRNAGNIWRKRNPGSKGRFRKRKKAWTGTKRNSLSDWTPSWSFFFTFLRIDNRRSSPRCPAASSRRGSSGSQIVARSPRMVGFIPKRTPRQACCCSVARFGRRAGLFLRGPDCHRSERTPNGKAF